MIRCRQTSLSSSSNNLLLRFLRFLYVSNVIIATAAAALGATALYLHGVAPLHQLPRIGFLWLATFGFYCLHDWITKRRLPSSPSIRIYRVLFWQQYGKFMLLPMGMAALAMSWIALHYFNRHNLEQTILLIIISLLYSLPILPFPGLKRWKDHALLKILVLSAVWTLATTIFLFEPGQPAPEWAFLAARWFFMLLLCIPFDVRDAAFDRVQMRRTLPDLLDRRRLAGCLAAITLAACILQYISLARLHQPGCTQVLLALHLLLTACLAHYALAYTQRATLFLLLDLQMVVYATIVGLCSWLA